MPIITDRFQIERRNWGLTMQQLHIKFGDRIKAFGKWPNDQRKKSPRITEMDMFLIVKNSFLDLYFTPLLLSLPILQ